MKIQHHRVDKNKQASRDQYLAFDQLNGWHPLQDKVPESVVLYEAQQRDIGQVLYFNFTLAQEMGLISHSHPHEMTNELAEKILSTFNLQIINEYDMQNRNSAITKKKPQKFMATRYLQLQHQNKQGKTSGDGRSIWNGLISNNGKSWDVSSRGTGVTKLSPGYVEAQKPLKTGSTKFGYGCGLAEIDELISSAIQSEIFHNQDIYTERMLCIIDVGRGCGVGVRAAPNLLRPAHLFLYLKQGRRDELKKSFEFFFEREKLNRHHLNWKNFIPFYSEHLAKLVAYCESHFIFFWLDWDGDNCLMHPGIIDYGSIRQFGLNHDAYRYDDVTRYSTSLVEQKSKAKGILQSFLQAVEFVQTGNKKRFESFQNHSELKKFKSYFFHYKKQFILERLGFDELQIRYLLKMQSRKTRKMLELFEKLEALKVPGKYQKLADGINLNPLLNTRESFYQLAHDLEAWCDLEHAKKPLWRNLKIPYLGSVFLSKRKRHALVKNQKHWNQFEKMYFDLIELALHLNLSSSTLSQSSQKKLKDFADSLKTQNTPMRLTGNTIIQITDIIFKKWKKENSFIETQNSIDRLILGHYNDEELSLILENRQSI